MSVITKSRMIRNEDVIDLKDSGKTNKDIAAILGCSKALVSNALNGKRLGPGVSGRYRPDIKDNIVIAMWSQGMNQVSIGKKLGCSTALVHAIVNNRRSIDGKKQYKKKNRVHGRMCSSCGGELEKGQHMLCLRCYTENSEGRRFNSI